MTDKINPDHEATLIETEHIDPSPYRKLEFNPDEFREDIVEFNYTKEQENEYLRTLFEILSIFVDLGWGVETVQNFLPELAQNTGQDSGNLLEDKSNINLTFNKTQQPSEELSRKDKP